MDDIGFVDEYNLSGGDDLSGYGETSGSIELGQNNDISKNERRYKVDEVGYVQRTASNPPNTKSIHRSGVSAEVITDSGLTTEQAQIREQNAIDGVKTEYFAKTRRTLMLFLIYQ